MKQSKKKKKRSRVSKSGNAVKISDHKEQMTLKQLSDAFGSMTEAASTLTEPNSDPKTAVEILAKCVAPKLDQSSSSIGNYDVGSISSSTVSKMFGDEGQCGYNIDKAHKDTVNEEVAKLETLLQNEVRLRKAAEEEIHNLKIQLLQSSKVELAGGNSNGIGLEEGQEEESCLKNQLEEEVRVLRCKLSQLYLETIQTRNKSGSGNSGNSHLGIIECLTSLNHLRFSDDDNGCRSSIANFHEQVFKVALQKIVSLLESEDADVRVYAVRVVANLAEEEANVEEILEAGGLSSLLMILGTYKDVTIRRMAAAAIANLANNDANRGLIIDQDGITLLAKTASDAEDPQTLRVVAWAIANLCVNVNDKQLSRLKSDGGIKALLEMALTTKNVDVIFEVARGIANFTNCPGMSDDPSLLIEGGALPWIVQNAKDEASPIRCYVEIALCRLAEHEVNAKDMISGGAVGELVRISRDGSREDIRASARQSLTSSLTFQTELRRMKIEV